MTGTIPRNGTYVPVSIALAIPALHIWRHGSNRSTKRMSCGLPQLRLRDGRMTCQVGPVIGRGTAPARQPLEWPPIELGSPGNGLDLRANSSLAGVDGASGFCSGGRGSGLSEPGCIGSIRCFFCATTKSAGDEDEDGEQASGSAHQQQLLMDPLSHGGAVVDCAPI
jgi:hypothetical protein